MHHSEGFLWFPPWLEGAFPVQEKGAEWFLCTTGRVHRTVHSGPIYKNSRFSPLT